MKVLAVGRPRGGIDARAAIAPHAHEELGALWRLYAAGTAARCTRQAAPAPLSHATHIKPLSHQRDHDSMSFAFDLWSCDDVSKHATEILARLRAGTMPCDGAWPPEPVDVLERWIGAGTPP